jgi:hypothetical protein
VFEQITSNVAEHNGMAAIKMLFYCLVLRCAVLNITLWKVWELEA